MKKELVKLIHSMAEVSFILQYWAYLESQNAKRALGEFCKYALKICNAPISN